MTNKEIHRQVFFDGNCIPEEIDKKMPKSIGNPLLANKIMFLVTNRCNLNCKYCFSYAEKQYQTDDMDPALAVSLLGDYLQYQKENNINFKYREIVFSGGEPTLNLPVILSVLSYLKKTTSNYIPVLLTNGIMRDETLNRLLKEKLFFQISYDGNKNFLRNNIDSNSISPQVISTIEKVSQAKLPFVIKATISNDNIEQMDDILDLAIKYNARDVYFSEINTSVGNAKKYNLSEVSVQKYIENYKSIRIKAQQYGMPLYGKPCVQTQINATEKQIMAPLVVLPDGSLTRSALYSSSLAPGTEKITVGKYTPKKGFVFNYDIISQMITNFESNFKKHCVYCSHAKLCRGGNENFHLFCAGEEIDQLNKYACEMSKAIFDLTIKSESLVFQQSS